MTDEKNAPSGLAAVFLNEASTYLKEMNALLLDLEKNPNNLEKISELLAIAHSLKGAAHIAGMENIRTIMHDLEDFFQNVQEKKQSLKPRHFDIIFSYFDATETLLTKDIEKSQIDKMLTALKVKESESGTENIEPEQAEAEKPKKKPKAELINNKKKIKNKNKNTETFVSAVTTPMTDNRVSITSERLDEILNYSGEIQLNRLKFNTTLAKLKTLLGNLTLNNLAAAKQIQNEIKNVENTALTFDQISTELQDAVMSARLVPISTLFDHYARFVRDFSKERKKNIEFKIKGEGIIGDREILNAVNEPLIHLMRNAVDHGIEPPEIRKLAGKPESGKIELKASYDAGQIVVEVSDDGAGISLDALKEKASKIGMIDEKTVQNMQDDDVLSLIFQPGFSTKEKADYASGRGVGLDIVKSQMAKVNGSVNLNQQLHQGTNFSLRFPISLSVSQVVIVRCANNRIAFPLGVINSHITLPIEQIKSVETRETIECDGVVIPLIRLATYLGLGEKEQINETVSVIVVQSLEQKMAFLVDEFIGEQEVVIKALDKRLHGRGNLFGTTILGDGIPALILNVPSLIKNIQSSGRQAQIQITNPKAIRKKRVLLVEDSLTTRELEKNILEAAGYEVLEAINGQEALTTINNLKNADDTNIENRIDMIVTDLDMPLMDGIELTAKIKSDKLIQNIPIVMVTYKSDKANKKRAMDAGADAYLIKSHFDQTQLLETIARLI